MTAAPRLPQPFLARPIAHRGYHDAARGRPENSRAAFSAAIDAGYGIELDLQMSADSVPMVFHDDDLGRLTAEAGPVASRSAAALGAIRLNHGYEGIPTLAEVLALVDGRVPLLIEIKDQDGALGPDVGALERATATVLAGHAGPAAVMSFNPHSVAAMARFAPGLPRGITTCGYAAEDWPNLTGAARDTLRGIPDYARTGAAFISHEANDLKRDRVADLGSQGAAVLCWTIRSPEAEAEARRIADNITFEGYAA